MAYVREVLEHLVRHSEGYHTPAARQEHLDALKVLDGPEDVAEPAAGTGQEGS